jgi:dolichol-phosphate mannosyltransferase
MPKTYIIIPTYNEAENIASLLKEIMALNTPDLTAVVVDDNSPDKTGEIADKLAAADPRIKVIHRYLNRGRGLAGIAGFQAALRSKADYIIEMDADLSHQPKYIPDLIKALDNFDVVLGSRFVKGGADVNRGLMRRITTFLARIYIKLILGVKVNDVTSGYRCFKREVLEAINLEELVSTGPSIVSEILYQVHLKGFKIGEVPIVFVDRTKGETKLNLKVLLSNLYLIAKFRLMFKM